MIAKSVQSALPTQYRRELPAPVRKPVSRAPDATGSLQDFVVTMLTELLDAPPDGVDAAIGRALTRLGQIACAERAYLFAIKGERMTNTNEWCSDGTPSRIAFLQDVPLSEYRWCMSHILKREILHIPHVRHLPDDAPDKCILLSKGIQSVLAVPIVLRSDVIGFVGFDGLYREKHWSKEMIGLLKAAAGIFGSAMARRTAEETLLKEKEFFSRVLETMGTLVIVLAPDGTFLRVNRAFTELTGLSIHELSGVGWQQVIPEDSRRAASHALRTALQENRTEFEGVLFSRSGETRTILWNGAVIRSVEGNADSVVLTGIDLTETLHLREQIEQSRRIDSLGRVAATIAHEFNNVLMAIRPWVEIIRRQASQQTEVQRCADRIEAAVKRGVQITSGVTRFARPADLARQTFDAREWLHAVVEEMRPVILERPGSPILVETSAADEHPWVHADPVQLHQVFSNLFLNAADATPAGGTITVSVNTTVAHESLPPELQTHAWVHWQVSDTGAGISPAVLERIFEPLFTTKKRGTGLGLAVAQQVIVMHGGFLTVDTALARGTTFHVFLPAADRPQERGHP